MARACVFCRQERKLTLEHAFPSWIARQLPDSDHVTSMTHTHRTEGKRDRVWTTANLDLKVRRVCGDCNSGWMSDLETTAQKILVPFIRGRRRGLAPVEQRITATWAIKTALMCEFLDPETRGGSDAQFAWIYEHRSPTPNAYVWLSIYSGAKEMDYHHRHLHLTPRDSAGPHRHGYLTAFVINRLVLYVIDFEGERVWQTLSDHAERAVLQIQPLKFLFPRWPPQVPLNDVGIEGFMRMMAPRREGE